MILRRELNYEGTVEDVINPFRLAIEDDVLADLRHRLRCTRWPEKEAVDDWSQGAPLEKVRMLCDYWANHYDWRRCEARLNALGQFRTEIDGLGIHFLHIRSPNPDALPLIITHGWPGSVIEFLDVIGPLTDPVAHGGVAADAFHIVIPSLPGFGFSDKPSGTGWGVERIASAWIELMKRLGYYRFVAQGGDWGAMITTMIGKLNPHECIGIHLNPPRVFPEADNFSIPPLRRRQPLHPTNSTVILIRATRNNREPGRRRSAMDSPIHRRDRLHGSTRSSRHGPITMAKLKMP